MMNNIDRLHVRRRLSRIALALLVVVAFGLPIYIATTAHAWNVIVVDQAGAPVPSAQIAVVEARRAQRLVCAANAEGVCTFWVRSSPLRVHVTAEGYAAAWAVEAGDLQAGYVMVLRKMK